MDLLETSAETFWRLGAVIGQLVTKIEMASAFPGYKGTLTQAQVHAMGGALGETMREAERLGLRSVTRQLERIKESIDSGPTQESLRLLMIDLMQRMVDELQDRTFLMVQPKYGSLLSAKEPLFGALVESKFPTASEDIAEAGKCIALARATGAVFHLMRVMEIAVQVLGAKLGVQLTTEKNWQVILNELDKAIRALDQKARDTKRYAAISAHLYNVKVAWRNEVMHPKQGYTIAEAAAIFDATKVFMNDLAALV